MTLPPVTRTAPSRRFALQRPSHARAEAEEITASAAEEIRPVQSVYLPQNRPFLARSLSAQLLELGLHHGLDDLIRKADETRNDFYVDAALRHYEKADAHFVDTHSAFYMRYSV